MLVLAFSPQHIPFILPCQQPPKREGIRMKKRKGLNTISETRHPQKRLCFVFREDFYFYASMEGKSNSFFSPFSLPFNTCQSCTHTHTLPPKIHENKKQTRRTNETNKQIKKGIFKSNITDQFTLWSRKIQARELVLI